MEMKARVIEFINSFLASTGSYGEIAEIEGGVKEVYDFIKGYISKRGIEISVLKGKDRIFLSKPNIEFEETYKVVKRRCVLLERKGIIEVWDDKENKLLNVVIPSVRKHFLINRSLLEKELKTGSILNYFYEYF